jgi:pimeloyl-ACP methyl ester carboxylesterase
MGGVAMTRRSSNSRSKVDLLLKRVANSRKVVVPKAGHALYMDDAETFHKELISFAKQLKNP